MLSQEPTDLTKLRYVLYARKSTEDEKRQIRSIPDQVRECRDLAERLGLRIVAEIRETKSAKFADQRPGFDKMVAEIKAGKYDAILCWHPDRLSRNAQESGVIMSLLDTNVLQDIRLHSHQFTNDANGKLLLGFLFVLSKHFSDDLSDKVSRGVDGNFREGKSSGSPKWGYDRDEMTGLYTQNNNFKLIQQAWVKREAGETLAAIAKFLEDSGYQRTTKGRYRRAIRPTKNSLAVMFKDPFYYGKLAQAGHAVDLREIYNFVPIITEETYENVSVIGYGRKKDTSPTKRSAFYPLRGLVFCAVCNDRKYMLVGKNRTGGGTYVLSYRCDNKLCTRTPRSLRARNVFNSIYGVLDGMRLSDTVYDVYSAQIDSFTDEKVAEMRTEIISRRAAITSMTRDINERSRNLGRMDRDTTAFTVNNDFINDLAVRRGDLEAQVLEMEKKIANPRQIKLGRDEFLNVVKMASERMKAGSAVEKDTLCRILFLNLRVDNAKVVDYVWNEPFASLIKAGEIMPGADERT